MLVRKSDNATNMISPFKNLTDVRNSWNKAFFTCMHDENNHGRSQEFLGGGGG